MIGVPTVPWGKRDREEGAWHPLVHHSADVSACLAGMLAIPVIRQRLAWIGKLQELSEKQVQRLAYLAALHDFGKFNRGFQNQIENPARRSGHVGPALLLLSDLQDDEPRGLGLPALRSWFESEGVAIQVLAAVVSHHGRPGEPKGDSADWRDSGGFSPLRGLAEFAGTARAWYPQAFADISPSMGSHVLPSCPEFQHALCGLVTLADWIGSDTGFFPFSDSEGEDRIAFARIQAPRALREIGIDVLEAHLSVHDHLPSLTEMLEKEPWPVQRAIEQIPIPREPSVIIMEAETGSGKTEAALRHFARLFADGLVDGMYFALPTRSAATQMHKRVMELVRRVLGTLAPPVVLAVPGYFRFDESEGKLLAPFSVQWPDDPAERERHRGWAAEHPKRYMAAAISVGTIDQVLLSTLQVRHSHLRAAALLRHLLVVDEVHASDEYMTALLEDVLRRHVNAGGHALLMSATLGSAARARFLGVRGETAEPTLEDAIGDPYPAIRVGQNGSAPVVVPVQPSGTRTIQIELLPVGRDVGEVARRALEAAAQGARVVILRNIVDEAVRTQRELEQLNPDENLLFRCGGVISLHHGRFGAEDRRLLDEAVEARFGGRESGVPGVLVATQTIEQSLDIDFDFLLTDLCPMDVLLQRLGRLHRHARTRPVGFDAARAVIVTPEERDLAKYLRPRGRQKDLARGPNGIGSVYEDLRILEATWRLLEQTPTIEIPSMNRRLVEEATHPAVLERLGEILGGAWPEHANRTEGRAIGRTGLARINAVKWDVPFDDRNCLFGERGLDQDLGTRLGEFDRLARFVSPAMSPFGNAIKVLKIPGWMAPAADEKSEAVVTSADSGVVQFTFGEKAFIYDRLGLREG